MKKKMLKPVNNHLVIEPIVQKSFMTSSDNKFQEIGVVISVADSIQVMNGTYTREQLSPVKVGDKVYFDSWLGNKSCGFVISTIIAGCFTLTGLSSNILFSLSNISCFFYIR